MWLLLISGLLLLVGLLFDGKLFAGRSSVAGETFVCCWHPDVKCSRKIGEDPGYVEDLVVVHYGPPFPAQSPKFHDKFRMYRTGERKMILVGWKATAGQVGSGLAAVWRPGPGRRGWGHMHQLEGLDEVILVDERCRWVQWGIGGRPPLPGLPREP